jgi:hypothetical protein
LRKVITITLIVAGGYFWPEISDSIWKLYNHVRSNFTLESPDRLVVTVETPKPAVVNTTKKTPVPVEHWKTIVVKEVPAATPVPVAPVVEATKTPEAPAPVPVPVEHKDGNSNCDPYQSKMKCGLKAVGRLWRHKP